MNKKTTNHDGDARLEALLKALDRFDHTLFERSKAQRDMHRVWTMAALPHIYGDEYEAKARGLLKRFGVESFSPATALFMDRSAGKTRAIAMWGAAFLWTQHNQPIHVFSISQRSSITMHAWILRELHAVIPEGHRLVVERNDRETLTIINALGERATICTHPMSKKLGGVAIHSEMIVMLDEASYMSDGALAQIVQPLLSSRKHGALLTISTPGKTSLWTEGMADVGPFLTKVY